MATLSLGNQTIFTQSGSDAPVLVTDLKNTSGDSIVKTVSKNGKTASKAIGYNELATTYAEFDYEGQEKLYLKSNDNTPIQTFVYKDSNNNYWYLICGIGDYVKANTWGFTPGGPAASLTSWHNNGSWSGTNTFGSLNTAHHEYKNKLYYDSSYVDILIMQGQSLHDISNNYFDYSPQVAYTNNGWLGSGTRGSNLKTFLSGNDGPNLTVNGATGQVQIPITFLKGSATESKGYHQGSSNAECNPTNVIDWGPQNNEGYRYAVVNALGCQKNGVNLEHYAWAADINQNYTARNFPGTNYDVNWGISDSYADFWYWLIWAKGS